MYISAEYNKTVWVEIESNSHKIVNTDLTHDFQNIGKPQVAFLFAVLLFMSIFLSWLKQQDLSVIIFLKKVLHSEPQHDL